MERGVSRSQVFPGNRCLAFLDSVFQVRCKMFAVSSQYFPRRVSKGSIFKVWIKEVGYFLVVKAWSALFPSR